MRFLFDTAMILDESIHRWGTLQGSVALIMYIEAENLEAFIENDTEVILL